MFSMCHDYQIAERSNNATTRTLMYDNECLAMTRHILPEHGNRKIFTHHHPVYSRQIKGVLCCKFDSNGLTTSFAMGCARSTAASRCVEGTTVELLFRHLS